jgi:sterol desaturase/sphingolipid hydroxylase (fatty acid hydroxylase superfamily)
VTLGLESGLHRSLRSSTSRRWVSNSVLFAVSGIGVFLVYPLSGIALAFTLRAASQGALNRVALPYSAQFAIGFAALDLTAYGSQRLFHAVAPLWRVHQVHHSETDLDLMTGLRFHPLEAVFTQGLILITIALLGTPPAAVAFSGAVALVQDFFQHANFRLPATADRVLRLLIITPPCTASTIPRRSPSKTRTLARCFPSGTGFSEPI